MILRTASRVRSLAATNDSDELLVMRSMKEWIQMVKVVMVLR